MEGGLFGGFLLVFLGGPHDCYLLASEGNSDLVQAVNPSFVFIVIEDYYWLFVYPYAHTHCPVECAPQYHIFVLLGTV